jgi:hypothetical protein
MSEAKRDRGRPEQPTVSIHLRVSPLEAELIDLRLAYMAEDAASKNAKPTCKTRPELLRYLLQDVEFLGRPFPHAGPWRERADAVIAKYDPPDQGAEAGVPQDATGCGGRPDAFSV